MPPIFQNISKWKLISKYAFEYDRSIQKREIEKHGPLKIILYRLPKTRTTAFLLASFSMLIYLGKFLHAYLLDYVSLASDTAEIYNKLAKDIVFNSLKGFNGTLFAYGQTVLVDLVYIHRALGKHLQ